MANHIKDSSRAGRSFCDEHVGLGQYVTIEYVLLYASVQPCKTCLENLIERLQVVYKKP